MAKREFAVDDAGQVQQVVDEPHLLSDVSSDRLERLRGHGVELSVTPAGAVSASRRAFSAEVDSATFCRGTIVVMQDITLSAIAHVADGRIRQ